MEMKFDDDAEPRQRQKEFLSSFIDRGSKESHRYYLSRRTILEMLRDRGYSIPDSEIEMSLHQFRGIYGQSPDTSRLRISVSHESIPSKKILVVFSDRGIIKVNQVRNLAGLITDKESLSRLIVVIQDKITDQAMKNWDMFPFKVEIFQITDLLVNVTKHKMMPKHRLLTNEEKEQLLKKYNVDEKQLPRIKVDDAIVRYYAFEKGHVLEVTSNSEITGSYVSYRCVW
ncbi:DNA-directed RNA polymerase RPB5 subunit, eukaryote/virus [Heracleum sosnowskyi]|uniref:DNA-directed RNA polymerase RPB5 subunit, eukaryote/virus n=1 Tax=Heracleum sosnowskyi TaxID=360622 RepID=A0AAD8HH30_9APIA|nr:DNA-directed RNA polymerase RPB5 subunit, eukaryote/virus [Heracleum sosnowskyi]